MGTYLYFTISPNRIPQKDWEKTYEKALVIADKCDLLDRCYAEQNGLTYAFAKKTAERDLLGKGLGIRVCGTMHTGYHMEDYHLRRDLGYYREFARENGGKDDDGSDILLEDPKLRTLGIPQPNHSLELWGGKTDGGPAHLSLLAIACLFADQFPQAVTIGGDITAKQCQMAVQLVEECLGIPIQLPVICRADALGERLRMADLPEQKKIGAFLEIYLGALDEQTGKVLSSIFPENALYQYFRDTFADTQNYYFSDVLKQYLLLGYDFPALLKMLVTDPEGPSLSPETALIKILSNNIHIPMDERNSLTWRDRNIPAYVPMDIIRAACSAISEDVDALIDGTLKELEERREKLLGDDLEFIIEMFMPKKSGTSQVGGSDGKKDTEDSENGNDAVHYDVASRADLFFFHPGCTFEPKYEESVLRKLRQVQSFDAERDFREFLGMSREKRENWFLQQGRYVLFREEVWERIFDHIMDDEHILRYYLMFRVDCSRGNVGEFVEAVMSSVEMFEMLWEKADEKKTEE